MRHRLKGVLAAGVCLIVMGSLAGCKTLGLNKIGIDMSGPPGEESRRNRHPHDKRTGPPDHAPAHGRRAQRAYRYYPDAEVYFEEDAGIYFFKEDGGWRMKARLPRRLRISLGDYVEIELKGDKPYAYHKKHKRRYPPGQRKKRKKRKKHKWKD